MSLPDRTPTVAAAQPGNDVRDSGITRLLVAALTLLVGWSRRARADARYVLAVAQHNARPALDPVDDHFDTAIRAAPGHPPGLHAVATLPPQLSHLELLAGEERENVIRGLVALGRPTAMANPGGPDPAALDEMARDVDPRRVHAATLYLDGSFVEIVRRTP